MKRRIYLSILFIISAFFGINKVDATSYGLVSETIDNFNVCRVGEEDIVTFRLKHFINFQEPEVTFKASTSNIGNTDSIDIPWSSFKVIPDGTTCENYVKGEEVTEEIPDTIIGNTSNGTTLVLKVPKLDNKVLNIALYKEYKEYNFIDPGFDIVYNGESKTITKYIDYEIYSSAKNELIGYLTGPTKVFVSSFAANENRNDYTTITFWKNNEDSAYDENVYNPSDLIASIKTIDAKNMQRSFDDIVKEAVENQDLKPYFELGQEIYENEIMLSDMHDALEEKYGFDNIAGVQGCIVGTCDLRSFDFGVYFTLANDVRIMKVFTITNAKSRTLEENLKLAYEQLEKSNEVFAEANEDNVLNRAILEGIQASKDIAVVNTYDEKTEKIVYSWSFDGSQIDGEIKEINLTLKKDEGKNKEAIKELFENKDLGVVLNFEHSGSLPKGTTVKVYVGDTYKDDDILSLFYYNEESKSLELNNNNLKVIDGYVSIPLTHCSDWALYKNVSVESVDNEDNQVQTGTLDITLYGIVMCLSITGIVLLLKKKAN